MNIEQIIVTRLNSVTAVTDIVSNRIYADILPEGAAYPAIIYSAVDELPYGPWLNADGDQYGRRFELLLITDSMADRTALTRAVKTSFQRLKGIVDGIEIVDTKLENITDRAHDHATGRTARSIDIQIYYRPTVEANTPLVDPAQSTSDTIEQVIIARLNEVTEVTGLVSNRIYADILPDETTKPAIVYQVVSELPFGTWLEADGDQYQNRFQLTLITDSMADRVALTDAVKIAFQRYQGVITGTEVADTKLENLIDLPYDLNTGQTARMVDFLIYYRETLLARQPAWAVGAWAVGAWATDSWYEGE